ncbi:hypothetical protein [Actinoplanes sp. NPDC051494]|uniref:MmyB family transcriptional regulator n=1 Tax=Actinoplanes sp. NPDC051494 TaxID=3363907 RepID=UPI0037874A17
MFAATFGDPTGPDGAARSALLWQFESAPSRVRQTAAERAAFEESLVADLRATTGRYPGDPDVAALVSRLSASPRFRELWALRSVSEHHSAPKVVEHPEVGDIALDSDVLTTQGSDLRLVVYTPRPGTGARSKLELLASIGTQKMTPSY